MKKTLISIIGICLMLLAITACQPRYTFVPVPGGGSSAPTGTPVSDAGELTTALENGEDVYLTQDIELNADTLSNLKSGNINGNGKTITIPESTSGSSAIATLQLNGVSINNAVIDVSDTSSSSSAYSRATTYTDEVFAILIQGSGTTLENVSVKTGGKAGINIHSATNVTLRNVTIDDCAKAPVNISSSTVIIDGITANGSSWYDSDNVIQVNGVGGNPNHTASTITFLSTGNIDRVWVEAVENTYNETAGITDTDFEKEGQTEINGLNWDARFSNQPSKGTKGWTYYAPDEDSSIFVLNNAENADSENDLRAMLAAIAGSDSTRKYSTIQLSKDVELDSELAITIPVTIDGAENAISRETASLTSSTQTSNAVVLIDRANVTLKNLTVDGKNTTKQDWISGVWGIKVYNSESVELEDITVSNITAGIQVNSSKVTVDGTIDVTDCYWGGIGVDQGAGLAAGELTIASGANIVSTNETKPAIYLESSVKGTISGADSMIHFNCTDEGKTEQIWYITEDQVGKDVDQRPAESVVQQ